jgi:CDGSH-type Zn-finger protein
MSDERTTGPRIQIKPNGPYLVSGSVPLIERYPTESAHGEPLAWDPVGVRDEGQDPLAICALCRCGHSENKPFCDGSHARVGFVGTLTADQRQSDSCRSTQVGVGMVMTDDPQLCVHAGFCETSLTNAWDMMERTGDPEVRARVEVMIDNCPSGRLQRAPTAGAAPVEPAYVRSIATIPDGPLWVRGGIPVEAPDGLTYQVRNRVTLCRCGQSRNKPFCDGTHKDVEFRAPGRDQHE